MSAPPIPQKTALGHEEQRQRTRNLGQRHRTILFLVDGRRTLSEVIALATQAGSTTVHFEDLVRQGFIEVPQPEPEPEPPPPSEGDSASGIGASLEIDVIPRDAEPEPRASAPAPLLTDYPTLEPISAPVPVPAPAAAVPPQPKAARVRAPTPISPKPLQPAQKPQKVSPAPRVVVAPVSREDEELLGEVRTCLLETVRLDGASFGKRMSTRVRQADTASAFINLVWELERETSHARRSREGLWNLQRARELLGLGNTLVAEDSRPNWPDSE